MSDTTELASSVSQVEEPSGTFIEIARWCLKVCGADHTSDIVATVVMIVISTIISVSLYWIAKKFLFYVVGQIVRKTKNSWDDYIFNKTVLTRASYLPSIFSMMAFGLAMHSDNWLHTLYMKIVYLYMTLSIGRFLMAMLTALFELLTYKYPRARSLKSINQLITYVIVALMVIVMVSIIIDKDPSTLLAGLGASAALVSLVFKETIASLVSGIQLSANNMLAPGDWISVPKANADGIVLDVNLNTVKIQNWDNTITTVPPSTLMTDYFVNYKGMQQGGGRRISRSILVDVTSIRFITPEEEMKFSTWPELNLFFENRKKENNDIGHQLTNMTLFREYMYAVLDRSQLIVAPKSATNMTLMVRTLAENSYGALPVEVYCFTRTKVWEEYEKVLSDVMNHMIASFSLFDLRPYSRNVTSLSKVNDIEHVSQQQLETHVDQAMIEGSGMNKIDEKREV